MCPATGLRLDLRVARHEAYVAVLPLGKGTDSCIPRQRIAKRQPHVALASTVPDVTERHMLKDRTGGVRAAGRAFGGNGRVPPVHGGLQVGNPMSRGAHRGLDPV